MQIVDPDIIRIHRVAHRRSLRWVADKVGCSHNQLSRYERGLRTEIPAEWALALSEVLEIPFARAFRAVPDLSVPNLSSGRPPVGRVA